MNDNGPPPDHVVDDEPRSDDEPRDARLEENIKSRSTWLRLLFMILFLALWSLSRIVVLAVVILQFFWVLLTGDTNRLLLGVVGQISDDLIGIRCQACAEHE